MISLQQVIGSIEQADDSTAMFYDTVTGETLTQFARWVSGIVDEELDDLLENSVGRFLRWWAIGGDLPFAGLVGYSIL